MIKPKTNVSDKAHTDDVSILILAEVYGRYPSPVSVEDLAEELNKSQRSIHSRISKMVERSTLIKVDSGKNGTMVQACVYEPVSRILAEQNGIKLALKALKEASLNGDESVNQKKRILQRIFQEYLKEVGDLIDRWQSLGFFEQLTDN